MQPNYLKCFLVALLTAVASFIYFIIKNRGFLTVSNDFNVQQITFAAAVWSAVHSSDPGQWIWNLDLGSSLINGFSFYNLGSPFYWISLLFPKGWFPYLTGPLYILKYTVAAMTAYLYLNSMLYPDYVNSCSGARPLSSGLCRKFLFLTRRPDAALIGALLYAFSGFQSINLVFNHFHDVVAVFPLLLWGIENIDSKKKRPAFILAIALNCSINYFFFIQSVIFMAIYFLFRFWKKDKKEFISKLLHCFLCGIVGVGIASIIFIPSILYITGNTRSEMVLYLRYVTFDSLNFLLILKGMLFPADCMRDFSALIQYIWNSGSCYIPLFGMAFVIAYCRRRTWLRNLLIFLIIAAFCPLLSSSFLLFTVVYQRWWYALTMMFALATAEVIREPEEYEIGKGIFWYVFVCIVFYLTVVLIDVDTSSVSSVNHPERFAYFLIIAVAGPILVDLSRRHLLFIEGIILPLTMCACVLTTALTLHYYRKDTVYQNYKDSYETALAMQSLPVYDQYRYNLTDNIQTLVGNVAGVGVFSSTIENSSHEFQRLLDVDGEVTTQNRGEVSGILQLLGCKYSITYDAEAANIVHTVSSEVGDFYITEQSACPIGFAVDNYILTNEVRALPQEQRGIALLNGVAVYPEDEEKVSDILKHLDTATVNFEESPDKLSLKAQALAVESFKRDNHGFSCTTAFDTERLIYFSVPNDKGWHAYIDGKESEIVNSAGMMLLRVPAGNHSIRFHYTTPGLKIGMLISVLSVLILGVFIVVCKGKKREGRIDDMDTIRS